MRRSPSADELWSGADRDLHVQDDRTIGTRLVCGFALQELEALAPADPRLELSVRRQLPPVTLQEDVEGLFLPGHAEHDLLRLGFLDPLDERVLDEPEDRDLVIRRQAPVAASAREVDANAVL